MIPTYPVELAMQSQVSPISQMQENVLGSNVRPLYGLEVQKKATIHVRVSIVLSIEENCSRRLVECITQNATGSG
jgi:hypothetical protein